MHNMENTVILLNDNISFDHPHLPMFYVIYLDPVYKVNSSNHYLISILEFLDPKFQKSDKQLNEHQM